MAKNPAPAATVSSVSRALGVFEDDKGNRLAKHRIEKTPYGPEGTGGYKVARGVTPTSVYVCCYAPDMMINTQAAEAYKKEQTALYVKALEAKGFTVVEHSYGLSVSRTH